MTSVRRAMPSPWLTRFVSPARVERGSAADRSRAMSSDSVHPRLFGTDGVRGVANVFPMTAEISMQLGRALAYLIRNGEHRHRVIIGKDTRLSGYMIEQALGPPAPRRRPST